MRKVLNAGVCGSMLFALAIAAPACGGTSNGDSNEAGSIQAGLTVGSSRHDVTAINYKVVDVNSTCNDPPLAEITSVLETEDLPSGVLPAGSGAHAGAAGLFVLPPGTYRICATPLGPNGPSAECAATEGTASVIPEAATEILLVSQCGAADGSGGLDVIAALNDPPKITNLGVAPSKFIIACETATLSAVAADPDGDQFGYSWTVVSAPTGSEARLQATDAVATFAADSPGDYQVRLAVTDIHGGSSSLTFPIHVSALSCTAQDQCHTAGICDLNTGACSNPSAVDGTSCDDGNGNTSSDVCTSGVCAGSTSSCSCPAGFTTLSDGSCQKSYDIDVNLLINQDTACDPTGQIRHNGCNGSNYGFFWLDEGGSLGAVTSVSVDLDLGVICSTGSRTVSMNGTPIGSLNLNDQCTCAPTPVLTSLGSVSTSSVVTGHANNILITPISCEGLSTSSALNGAYGRVTVNYALPSSCTNPPTTTCSHDICTIGGPLTSTCDTCVAQICAVDPFCCNNGWDSLCRNEVGSVCGQTCS
jgi:hypothetical protein